MATLAVRQDLSSPSGFVTSTTSSITSPTSSTSSKMASSADVDTFTLSAPISTPTQTNASSSGSQVSGATVFLAALATVVAAVCIILGITCLIMRVRRNSPKRYRKTQERFPATPVIIADESTFPELILPRSNATTPLKGEFGSPLMYGKHHERSTSKSSFLSEMQGDNSWMKEPVSPPPPVWDHYDEERSAPRNLYPPSPRLPLR